MLFRARPKKFTPKFEVVSCFCEYNGKILLLQRQDSKPQGGKWGVPAGKRNGAEPIAIAMTREMKEETGKHITPTKLLYFRKVYVKYPDFDFIYHIFHTMFNNDNIVTAINEHKNHVWATPIKALNMDLIEDLDTCIKMFYKM